MAQNKLLIGNWKLNPIKLTEAKTLAKNIIKHASYIRNIDIVLCPSILHVGSVKESYGGKKIKFGTQDISLNVEGPHTGDVSPRQLVDLRIDYVIIGHSERRFDREKTGHGETNALVAKKARVAIDHKLTPIICIGESVRNPDGAYLKSIKKQLTESLSSLRAKDLSKVVIAYEPIWAIGKGAKHSITGHDLHEMYLYLQKLLTELWGSAIAKKVTIIYGGSVKPENAKILSTEGMMDGFLVGGASLDSKSFIEIAKLM